MDAEYMRLYRARKKAEGRLAKDDPRHGSVNGYDNYGCRCDACRAAAAAKMKRWRYGQ